MFFLPEGKNNILCTLSSVISKVTRQYILETNRPPDKVNFCSLNKINDFKYVLTSALFESSFVVWLKAFKSLTVINI